MHRPAVLAALALGALLLPSCYNPPPPYGPDGQRGPGFLPPPERGDGYVGPNRPDPYGSDYGPESGDPYAQRPRDNGQGPYGPPPQGPQGAVDPQPTAPKRTDYPTATRTAKPNQVLSPYAPYNVIDVSGIQSGKLAKDPSTGEIFRVP